MTLDVLVAVPARGVEVALTAPLGSCTALLGANGAGKTTVVEALAGLLVPDGGHARLGSRELYGPRGGRLASTEPRHRRVALVSQDASLFPHKSVLDNVAFPLRARGAGTHEARSIAREWLDRCEAGHLAQRGPRGLSGGEARRVAIARALAAEPDLLLLDEPFAALDVRAAGSLRALVARELAGRTAVLTTHDGLDAVALSHQVAVLDGGRVAELGPTARVFSRPHTPFAAAMAGLAFARGVWTGRGLTLADGRHLPATAGDPLTTGASACVAIDPRRLTPVAAHASLADDVPDVVVGLEPRGEGIVRLRGELWWADLSLADDAARTAAPGAAIAWRLAERPVAYAT